MPHYKDGTAAKEGDTVRGIPYNTGGKEVVGIITNINSGAETCNCLVIFMQEIIFPKELQSGLSYKHYRRDGISHFYDISSDYGEVKAFEKIL